MCTDYSVFDNDQGQSIMSATLRFKWNAFAGPVFYIQFAFYLVYVALIICMGSWVLETTSPMIYRNECVVDTNVSTDGLVTTVLVINVIFLLLELQEVRDSRSHL